MNDNFYEILELGQDCKQEEIDKAYKKLALRYHPDRNPGDSECADKFVKIQQAYDTLKDPSKRRMYDMQRQGGGMPHFAHMHVHDMEDLNVRMSSVLSFEEAVLGTKKTISLFRKEPCYDCAGEGHKSFTTCAMCNGRGSTIAQFGGMIQFATMCANCHGRGKLGTDKCKTCNAARYLTGSESQIEIAFPAGIINGMTLSVNGAGHKGKNGNQGNILVTCNVADQKKYSLRNLDIYFNFEVPFSTMLFGGTIEIPTFENDLIEVQIPARTQNLTNFRIKGKGMPAINNKMLKGDLVAVAITKIPVDKEFIPELQGILEHHGI